MHLTKYLLRIFAFLTIAITAMACSSDDDKAPTSLSIESVSKSAFPASGGDLTITVKASATPKIYLRDNWLTPVSNSVTGTTYTYNIKVAANTGAERSARISFALEDKSVTAEITQEGAPEPETPDTPPYTPGTGEPAMMLGLGWNLGNHMDAHVNGVANETSWGNKAATQQLFDKLAADGLTTVRIPVTWLGKVGAAPDYTIDKAWLNRVYDLVCFAERSGLKVIINIHHDGADTGKWLDVSMAAKDAEFYEGMKAQFTAMWTQIATRFTDKGDFLIFEPFNELHDGGWGWGNNRNDGGKQYQVVNELNQIFVDAVRAAGGKNTERWLSAVGYCSNPDLTMDNLKLPIDPTQGRTLVAVHFYDPTPFTLEAKRTDWGHTGDKNNKENWGDEDNVRNIFGKLQKKYSAQGIPVYIGEGGCVHHATDRGETFRKYYLEYVARAAHDYGLGFVIWDNGSTGAGAECHGYYNHATGSYINNSEEIMRILTTAYYSDDATYTLQSIYDRAPKF